MTREVPTPLFARLAARRVFWYAAAQTLVIDQLAKAVAQAALEPEGWQASDPSPHYPWVEGLVHGTWGLGHVQARGTIPPTIIAAIVWGFLCYYIAVRPGARPLALLIGGGMVMGGVVGNLIDEVVVGGVRNFMVLGFDHPLGSPPSRLHAGAFALRPSFGTGALAIALGFALVVGSVLMGIRSNEASRRGTPVVSALVVAGVAVAAYGLAGPQGVAVAALVAVVLRIFTRSRTAQP